MVAVASHLPAAVPVWRNARTSTREATDVDPPRRSRALVRRIGERPSTPGRSRRRAPPGRRRPGRGRHGIAPSVFSDARATVREFYELPVGVKRRDEYRGGGCRAGSASGPSRTRGSTAPTRPPTSRRPSPSVGPTSPRRCAVPLPDGSPRTSTPPRSPPSDPPSSASSGRPAVWSTIWCAYWPPPSVPTGWRPGGFKSRTHLPHRPETAARQLLPRVDQRPRRDAATCVGSPPRAGPLS